MNWPDQPQPAHRRCFKRDLVTVREWMLVSHCLIESLTLRLSCDGTACGLPLAWPGGELWAIEVKRSLSPKVEDGFHSACEDLGPARQLVVYPGSESFPLGNVCMRCRCMPYAGSWPRKRCDESQPMFLLSRLNEIQTVRPEFVEGFRPRSLTGVHTWSGQRNEHKI